MTTVGSWRQRRWVRWSGAATGVFIVTVAASVPHLFVLFFASFDCAAGWDTDSEPLAASASPQGWLCGSEAPLAGQVVWLGAFALSLVATVVVVVLAWRRASWPGALMALVVLGVAFPVVTALVLNLPSDDCSAHARATHPEWACVRE